MPRAFRYTRLYFADDDLLLYYEVAEDAYAERHVVVERVTGRARTAASWSEWRSLTTEDDRRVYASRYGPPPQGRMEAPVPAPSYEDAISKETFDGAWARARRQLDER